MGCGVDAIRAGDIHGSGSILESGGYANSESGAMVGEQVYCDTEEDLIVSLQHCGLLIFWRKVLAYDMGRGRLWGWRGVVLSIVG